MTNSQISTLWGVVGLALLYYALNAWIVTQGGAGIFPVPLLLTGRVPAAVAAILICSILLIVASFLGAIYAGRDALAWHRRIPVLGFKSLNTDRSRLAQAYQLLVLVCLSLVPAAALVHFGRLVLEGKVVSNVTGKLVDLWDFGAFGWDNPARICGDLDGAGACADGVTFFPGVQPLIYALLIGVAIVAAIVHWLRVFGLMRSSPAQRKLPARGK